MVPDHREMLIRYARFVFPLTCARRTVHFACISINLCQKKRPTSRVFPLTCARRTAHFACISINLCQKSGPLRNDLVLPQARSHPAKPSSSQLLCNMSNREQARPKPAIVNHRNFKVRQPATSVSWCPVLTCFCVRVTQQKRLLTPYHNSTNQSNGESMHLQ